MSKYREYMGIAIEEAYEGINNNEGGPFGAVVVKDDKVIGRGHNRVIAAKDPTCHGELEAIRDACKHIGNNDLSGCQLYTTAEPCPMCLGGILWANIDTVYYGCTVADTDRIGFRDDKFYAFFKGEGDILKMVNEDHEGCQKLFDDYVALDRKRY